MTFRIEESEGELRAGERLWLTADQERLVPEGDPEAAFLFVAEGQAIDPEQAKRFGLGKQRGKRRA